MRGLTTPAVLVALCLAFACLPVRARCPLYVEFVGYKQLNGWMVFQLQASNLPPACPCSTLAGFRLPFGSYQVDDFHEDHKIIIDPVTGQTEVIDVSTLELDNLDTGEKTELPFGQQVDLTPARRKHSMR
jgi:hypothetical protein